DLRPPAAFAGVADRAARSRALFGEAAKVLTHPRCLNCHPAGDHPLQGDDDHAHQPAVVRGESGDGIAGATCQTCHMSRTIDLFAGAAASYQSIPGHPRWQLAPPEMAWEGKSVGAICRQLKDKARNGGRDLAMIHEHLASDDLVAYGWHPGEGRAPAPGTQQELGEIIQAWIDTGAECP
ncbi:MAG TPA: Isoquinoline 1-oxidoreductase subunit, partial [Xanthobacteraceae bacterium]|nr:Isoquinoline 1-oxidoreductase subunit [Xanthobacteraceae bacterium]